MKTTKSFFFFISLITLLFTSACRMTTPSTDAEAPSLFNHWERQGVSEIMITTDLRHLLDHRNEEHYQPASATWAGSPSFSIGLRPRGITRRAYCDFPPLKLNFKKADLRAAGIYPEFDKIKLVTECMDDESLVLREYLAYQLYGELTMHSFRTRLVRVHFIDSQDRVPAFEQYAVVLEPKQELAQRLGGTLFDHPGQLRTVDAHHYRLLTVYQYMIGNTDWNLNKSHNITLVQPVDGGAPVPIPYDFDYAGLTNAPYAIPHPQLPVANVRERFFQWRGKDSEGLRTTLRQFRDQKADLLGRVDDLPAISAAGRDDLRTYLESFFSIIERGERLGKELFVNVSERPRNIS